MDCCSIAVSLVIDHRAEQSATYDLLLAVDCSSQDDDGTRTSFVSSTLLLVCQKDAVCAVSECTMASEAIEVEVVLDRRLMPDVAHRNRLL